MATLTPVRTSFSCYECGQSGQGKCSNMMINCPMCMIFRNDNDPSKRKDLNENSSIKGFLPLDKFDRRCCWSACGIPNQVSNYNGRPTYFCNADKCNGPGSELMLGESGKSGSFTNEHCPLVIFVQRSPPPR